MHTKAVLSFEVNGLLSRNKQKKSLSFENIESGPYIRKGKPFQGTGLQIDDSAYPSKNILAVLHDASVRHLTFPISQPVQKRTSSVSLHRASTKFP